MSYKNLSLEDMDGEKWATYPDNDNYHISNMGRVKSIPRKVKMPNGGFVDKPESIIRQRPNTAGYLYANIGPNRCGRSKTIHRIVAQLFVVNPDPIKYKLVDHIKGNKLDNRHSMLRWVDHAINNKQAYELGLKVGSALGKFGADNCTSKPVLQYSINGEFIARHPGQREAMRATGIRQSNISDAIVNPKRKSAGGFIWRFDGQAL